MIPSETILEAEDSLRGMDDRETIRAVRQFERKQPAVFVYLAAISQREEFNEDEQDVFFTIALVLWMAIVKSCGSTGKVPMKKMEELDKKALAILEAGHGSAMDGGIDSAGEPHHREPNLMTFILRRCNEPDAGTPLREESKPLMVYFLKVVLKGLLSIDED